MKPHTTMRFLFALVVQFALAGIATIGSAAENPTTNQPSATAKGSRNNN